MQEWAPDKVVIKGSELKGLKELAKGRYGTVFKGECRGQVVAVKILHNQHLPEEKLAELRTEVEIMSQLRHPCILLFMGICTEPGNIAIVMEYLEGKSLDKILHNHNIKLSDVKKLRVAKDIAKGLNWLHCLERPILHRDLKPPNILVGSRFNVKVCDFGLSCVKEMRERGPDELEDTAVGSPIWMAPEVLSGYPNTEKSDVYAYGIILWEIVTRKPPFSDVTSFEQFIVDVVDHNKRPPLPEGIQPSLGKLITDCWAPDPKSRPSFAQILKRLDDIILESLISDPVGRQMWTKLAKKDSVGEGYPFYVKWEDFIKLLCQNVGIKEEPATHIGCRCIKDYLSEKYQDDTTEKDIHVVTCEEFGNFLRCFGPFKLEDKKNIVTKLQDVCATHWFFGAVSTQDAEKKLKNDRGGNPKKGTFMVRLSSTKDCFTITKVAKDGNIIHQRVVNQDGEYLIYLGKEPIKKPSLQELIDDRAIAAELGLKNPLAQDPFAYIFSSPPPTKVGINPQDLTGNYVGQDTSLLIDEKLHGDERKGEDKGQPKKKGGSKRVAGKDNGSKKGSHKKKGGSKKGEKKTTKKKPSSNASSPSPNYAT